MARLVYNGTVYDTSDAWSGRDFLQRDFSASPPHDLVIYASVFAQELPDTPALGNVTGATFIRCNLTNVLIPRGNTLIDCLTTRMRVQNDGRDWELNNRDEPVRVCSEKYWLQQRCSVDPADIPPTRLVLAPDEDLVERLATDHATREGR